jgi:hypothetical protein
MLITKKHLLTMFTMAGILVAASSVNAASIVNGDLLLGFRVTGGTGAGTDLIVRAGASGAAGIGNAVTFRDATTNIATVVDVGAELAAIYGAGWATRADLSWGVVGVRSASSSGGGSAGNGQTPGRSPFIGIAQSSSNPAVQSSAAPDLSGVAGLRTNASNAINAINVAFTAGTDTGTSAAEAIHLSSSALGGYTEQQAGFFTLAGGTEVSDAQGIDNSGLDLYWITNSNTGAQDNGAAVTSTVGQGIYQGSFQISDAGVVSFNVTAVPEPSRALLAGLGLAGIAFRRRRSTKKIA